LTALLLRTTAENFWNFIELCNVTELYVLQNEILGYKPQFHHGSGPEVDDDDDDDGSTFLCCTLLHSTESSNFILTSEFTCEVYYLAD